MAKREWTPQQRQAIDDHNGSLLISAAAGSGKTAVLVERVVRLITHPTNAVDIDRLLIVTFTKAAAAEMKQRLSARLGDFIAQDPENTRLQRQQMLLPTAPISTIDGFCTSFLREHFDACGISPRFSVAEGATETMLRNEALDETLEVFYAAAEDGFSRLADLINGRKDDAELKKTVLATYDFIRAQAFPFAWLREACAIPENTPLSETVWGKWIRRYVSEHLLFLCDVMNRAADTLAGVEDATAYLERLIADIAVLRNTALIVADPANDWDACAAAVQTAVPGDLRGFKEVDKALKKIAQDTWTMVRKDIREKLIPSFGEDEQTAMNGIRNTKDMLTALCEVVEAFTERYAQKKNERQLLDFSDLEHLTLELLCDAQTGEPTALAKEAGAQFAEILVDEYQDTNDVQDTIFRMLSNDNNLTFCVGDVKQSIYGFRQAMPEIFMGKKREYAKYDSKHYPAYITLGNNFRSRKEVTGAVNFVFEQLMTREFCGIDYCDNEQLIPSNTTYPAMQAATEVLLLDNPFAKADMDADVLEARLIADRIRELIASGTVTENGQLRPVKYSDICILTRSRGTHAATLAAELNRLGIPSAVDVGVPFFKAPEIQATLALLRAIDNPLRDVSLAAMLLSPVAQMTANDLATLRVHAKTATPEIPSTLYGALLAAEPCETISAAVYDKVQRVLRMLQHYRRLALALPADILLTRLLEETALLAAVAADDNSRSRVEHIHELMQFARDFEQNGFKGLSAFVRYMDRMESEKDDLFTSPAHTGNSNTVSLMTIHGSKGLEFPIVFMARLFGQFNRESSKKALLLNGKVGAAISDYDPVEMNKTDTVAKRGVKLAIRYTEFAEELRVLYVAMTRAKEKLITVFVQSNLVSRIQKLASFLSDSKTLTGAHMLSLHSLGDWLISAFLRHPDAQLLRHIAGDTLPDTLSSDAPLICREYIAAELADSSVCETDKAQGQADMQLVAAINERIGYQYPFAALHAVPVKMAASVLAHKETDSEFIAHSKPSFLSTDGLTGAQRGTATHAFMQYADHTAAANDPAAEAERLYHDGFLTEQQVQALNISHIRTFFASDLYKRMANAAVLHREYDFAVLLSATAYDNTLPDTLENENIVVQGMVDCLFEENGELVVVDYKTDRVKDGDELRTRYKKQLDIYSEALTKLLGKPVKETLLYSFHLDKIISV